jgi:hypothetical protein
MDEKQLETDAQLEAIDALRARGVDTAAALLEHGTPEQILTACRRWDRRTGVGPGLLAQWIRNGEFEDPEAPPPAPGKGAALRALFDDVARRFPIGSVVETHAELIERRWPQDLERARETGQPLCAGWMVVTEASWPALEVECEACNFDAGYPARALRTAPWAQER